MVSPNPNPPPRRNGKRPKKSPKLKNRQPPVEDVEDALIETFTSIFLEQFGPEASVKAFLWLANLKNETPKVQQAVWTLITMILACSDEDSNESLSDVTSRLSITMEALKEAEDTMKNKKERRAQG